MFTKLFVAESTGALGNVQNHTRCSALPLVAEAAALVVRQLCDQRLGDEGESTSMLPCHEFLEVSHTPRWAAQCDNQHRLFAGGSLFLRRGACHLEPLRRLRNCATSLATSLPGLRASRCILRELPGAFCDIRLHRVHTASRSCVYRVRTS